VPRGRSPYRDWNAAAIDAYKIDGLDQVGLPNQTAKLTHHPRASTDSRGWASAD
jgi:hypothetical protein